MTSNWPPEDRCHSWISDPNSRSWLTHSKVNVAQGYESLGLLALEAILEAVVAVKERLFVRSHFDHY